MITSVNYCHLMIERSEVFVLTQAFGISSVRASLFQDYDHTPIPVFIKGPEGGLFSYS